MSRRVAGKKRCRRAKQGEFVLIGVVLRVGKWSNRRDEGLYSHSLFSCGGEVITNRLKVFKFLKRLACSSKRLPSCEVGNCG